METQERTFLDPKKILGEVREKNIYVGRRVSYNPTRVCI